ncbi:hypothetical protein [Lactiplantibacillus daowaiensis]|uniref:Uncharacterized protein n=1 Tax=Lactiplantibacillus daowaiensis TaxID=2559918 RepID=A0ABW1RXN7_9LACO|nr:hypothetical protein [Lactiplantibacillus daowaiensis]
MKLTTLYDPQRPTLLLSLHPENTQAILAQTKWLEYRRRFFQQAFQAFVYTTGRQGGVNLYLQCGQPIKADAATLAQIGQQVQNDDYDKLYDYYAAQNTGLTIPILKAVQLPQTSLKSLRTRFSNFVTPQSYVYLNRPERQSQLDYLLTQPVLSIKTNDWTTKIPLIQTLLKNPR